MATSIEDHLRDEDLSEWTLVIRGRPLTDILGPEHVNPYYLRTR